jgi:hypothetical protein
MSEPITFPPDTRNTTSNLPAETTPDQMANVDPKNIRVLTFGEAVTLYFDVTPQEPVNEPESGDMSSPKETTAAPLTPPITPAVTATSHTLSAGDDVKAENTKQPVFIVLQHSSSAGNSALLPSSSVMGIFTSREDALDRLHSLKYLPKPTVKPMFATDEKNPWSNLNFWCTNESGDDASGYRYKSEGGEEFVVWIEEHELNK